MFYVISPCYLRAIYQTAKDYSFDLQGYGNWDSAIQGLSMTNISNIKGFVYLDENLPTDVSSMSNFLRTVDVMSVLGPKPFVVALHNSERLTGILSKLKLKNLTFFLHEFDILTDLDIKQNIFGTLLRKIESPYKLFEETKSNKKSYLKSLSFTPALSSASVKVLDSVVVRPTVRETEIEDRHLSGLKRSNSMSVYDDSVTPHYLLRLLKIHKAMNLDTEELLKQVETEIGKVTSPKLKLELELLLQLIQEDRDNA